MGTVVKLRVKSVWIVILAVLFTAVLIFFPSAVSKGVSKGLGYTAELLIPSLFPFMVLSSFMIRSNASYYIGKIFSPITKFLFRLPYSASSGIILSLTGGFPIGAKSVKLLYESGQIDKNQANRMMMFCVCSGSAFLITAVGAIMLNNVEAGVILYISQLISSIILGVVSARIFSERETGKNPEDTNKSENPKSIVNEFIKSCSDGALAITELTALVVVFSLFISVAEQIGISEIFSWILCQIGIERTISEQIFLIILEVTTACKSIAQDGCPLWLIAFGAGFGGICVHFQIFSILKDVGINKFEFELFRLANAVISAGITYLICCFYKPSVTTFAVSDNTNAEITSSTIAGALALVIMSAVFLLSLKRNSKI